MTEETTALFEALFSLEEIRELLRQSAPSHKLSDEQKKILKEKIAGIRKCLAVLERLE
jgi:hypothetical protein